MPAYVGVIFNFMRIDKYPNKPKTGWKPAGSVNFRGSPEKITTRSERDPLFPAKREGGASGLGG